MNTGTREAILAKASALRWDVGEDFHDTLMETIYSDAARIADRAVTPSGTKPRFSWDRTLDRLLTSRWTGFPVMFLLLMGVFWITITGANIPSAAIASLLLDTLHPWLKSAAAGVGFPWWKVLGLW